MSQADSRVEAATPPLTFEEALERITTSLQPLPGSEKRPIRKSLGRILAEDLYAPKDIPAHSTSVMDGYAFNSADISKTENSTLKIVGISWAGHPLQGAIKPGQCARIFTGAVVPEGADTVIMQENVIRREDAIILKGPIKLFDHIRQPGADVAKNHRLLSQGKQLNAADLGLLAACGTVEVPVKRKLRIAFFSTGDELRALGEQLKIGEIYDSNRYMLYGLLEAPWIELSDMGSVGDQKMLLKDALIEASSSNDVVITTGGASAGEADLIKQALTDLGQIIVGGVAIKPGKASIFGKIGGRYLFALPGNPVSVMVAFHKLVKPALYRLAGADTGRPLRLRVPSRSPLTKLPGRLEFQRGRLAYDAHGQLTVISCGAQDSHLLSSMSQANCFIILPPESGGVEAGEKVEVEPFGCCWVNDQTEGIR